MYKIQVRVHALALLAIEQGAAPQNDHWHTEYEVQKEMCDPDLNPWVTTWMLEDIGAAHFDVVWDQEPPSNFDETKRAPWFIITFTDQVNWAVIKMQYAFKKTDIKEISQ